MTFTTKSKNINGYHITANIDKCGSHYIEIADKYGRTVERRTYTPDGLNRAFSYYCKKYKKEA